MATPRKSWPDWAASDYADLHRLARRVNRLAEKARAVQHHNVYLTGDLLSRLVQAGQQISSTARRLELDKGGRKWPDWANRALATAKKSGKYVSAGGKHGLDGLEQDNWKMVLVGLTTCLEHAGKIEAALSEGPGPEKADVIKEAEAVADSAAKGKNGRTIQKST